MGLLETIRRETAALRERMKQFIDERALVHRAELKLREISGLEAELKSLRAGANTFTTRTGLKVESREVKQLRQHIATREQELAELLDQIELRQSVPVGTPVRP